MMVRIVAMVCPCVVLARGILVNTIDASVDGSPDPRARTHCIGRRWPAAQVCCCLSADQSLFLPTVSFLALIPWWWPFCSFPRFCSWCGKSYWLSCDWHFSLRNESKPHQGTNFNILRCCNALDECAELRISMKRREASIRRICCAQRSQTNLMLSCA